jgi:predicted transposase YdaD
VQLVFRKFVMQLPVAWQQMLPVSPQPFWSLTGSSVERLLPGYFATSNNVITTK